MFSKRLSVLLGVVVIGGLLLAACATPTPEVIEKVVTQVVKETVIVAGTPQVVEKEVTRIVEKEVPAVEEGCGHEILIGINGDGQSVNPLYGYDSSTVFRTDQISEPLVFLDWKTLEPIPWLAESWDVSEDGTTYTFHLREGPKWPDGTPLTAQDFEFTLLTILSPDYTGPWQGFFANLAGADKVIAGEAQQLEGLKVIDDKTFQLKLNQPNAPFLALSARHLKPVPKHLLEGEELTLEHPFMRDPVGVGPYRLVEWMRGDHLTLEAKDDYWGGTEPICARRITEVQIPDMEALAAALESGSVDHMNPLEPRFVLRFRDNPDIELHEPPTPYSDSIYFNIRNEFLANPKVRQAIAMTLDLQEFADEVLLGVQAPVLGPLLPGSWAYDPTAQVPGQDLEKAKALLVEAGYPDGFTVRVTTNAGNTTREQMATYLQAQVAKIGIQAEVQLLEWSTFWTEVVDGKSEIAIQGSSGGIPDPDSLYNSFHTKGPNNYGQWGNPELDRVLEEARVTMDRDQRKKLYQQAQQILVQDLPMIWAYEYLYSIANRTNISNVRPAPLGPMWDSKYWRKK